MPTRTPPKTQRDAFGTRSILAIAIPLAATVGCFSITLFTDRTLLMWYGPISSAASVSAGNLYWAVACIPVTALGFITPLVARAMGQQRFRGAATKRIWALLWQGIWLTIASVPILAVVGWYSPKLFAAFGHEAELAVQEARYFQTLLLVAPASMLEAGLTAFFVGRRITRPILRSNILSASLNVGLDFWFIFGGIGVPAMGVFGAALATAVSMWFKVAVFVFLLMRLKSFRRHYKDAWKPNAGIIREIVVPGSALGVQQLIRSSLFSYVLLVIGSVSVVGLAGTSAAFSLYQLLSIPAIGLATALTVVTGQAIASGGPSMACKVIQRGIAIGCVVATTIAVLLFMFPHLLLKIQFGGLEPAERMQLQPMATKLLRFAAVYGLADIASLLLGAFAKGIGWTFIILVATAIPGGLLVGIGRLVVPTGEAAVVFWWSVLIMWAIAQAIILGSGLLIWSRR